MKRFVIYTLLTLACLCLLGLLASSGQAPGQQPLIQTTNDIEVRVLSDTTELSLPPGTRFVVGEEPGGRVVLRFRRAKFPPGLAPGQTPIQ